MLISHLKLKNWRNFRTVDVSLGERVFLCGPNASGKSNFLDAFRFLRDVAKPAGGGLQKAIQDRGGLSKIRCLSAREDPNVELEIELTDAPGGEAKWRYALGIKQAPRGDRKPYVGFETAWRGKEQIFSRPDSNDRNDPVRLSQTFLQQINANQPFREVARFLESVLYLHLVPQLVRHPEAFAGPGIPEDPFGRNFLERVAKAPDKTKKARLKKIEKALRLAVPQLKDLSHTTDEMGIPHLEAIYSHWRAKGAKQREDQFSDGTLRLMGLLWSLLDGDSVLLLEEPELSLHGGIVRKLPGLIFRLQRERRRQVIISSHSVDLLSDKGIAGEEVLLLTPGPEGTTIEPASSNLEVRALLEAGLSISEAALPRTVPPHVAQLDMFE